MALAGFIANPAQFYFVFVMLLGTDVVWAVLSMLAARQVPAAVLRWCALNALTGGLFYFLAQTPSIADDKRPFLFFWLALVRTTIDYGLNIDFYLARRATNRVADSPSA